MFAATDYAGIGVLVVAIATSIASVLAAVMSALAMLRAGRIQHEVRTMNELTLGQLGEAQETRRVELIPPTQRTAQESRHVADDRRDDPRL